MSQFLLPLDSETGGLNCKEADMLTFYMAIADENLNVIDEIDLKLKPDGRLPMAHADALRVNGINIQEHLADPETITYSQAKPKVVALLKKYLKKNGRYSNLRVFGQNVTFDLDFIYEYLIPKNEWDAMVHYGKVDTKVISDFLKDAGWFPKSIGTLGSMVEHLGIPMRKAHTAKDDTLMALEVYKKILEIMAAKKNNSSQQDLISLLEAE